MQGRVHQKQPWSGIQTASLIKPFARYHFSFKGKGKGLGTCYSATYMSQTRDQQHFTISEGAAEITEIF